MTTITLVRRSFLLTLLVALTGGCVTASSTPSSNTGQAKFNHDRAVHYDLTEPRSAQDLGVPVGQTSAMFGRGSGDPLWDISMLLPGGTLFQTKGFGVDVSVGNASTVPINEIVVNTHANTTAEMDAALNSAVKVLGIKASEVAIWNRELAGYPLTNVHATDNFVFDGAPAGYLTVEVEARVQQGSPGASINYTFSWDPATIPSPMPSPAAAAPSKK